MKPRLNILISMPTGEYSERMKLEGVVQYAHEKRGVRWNLKLDIRGKIRNLSRPNTASKYDGVIAYVGSDEERRLLLSIRLPMVLIEDLETPSSFSRRKDVVTLLCDHEAEGRTAANYFLQKHYANFAYVGDEKRSTYDMQRQQGFTQAVRDAGLSVSLPKPGVRLADWLKTLTRPCALYAVHDLRARQVLDAAEDADISVPSELAVLGTDNDITLCTTSSPMLSSIPTFDHSLGYAAGRALNEVLLGRAKGRVIRTRHAQIVTRNSTDTEAVSDAFVAKALNWARQHLSERLSSATLAKHAGCSQSYLQSRTEQSLGTSLSLSIRRLRLATAAELLSTTDLPVATIAAQCGFPCTSYLAVLMKKSYGLTPLAYRKSQGLQGLQRASPR